MVPPNTPSSKNALLNNFIGLNVKNAFPKNRNPFSNPFFAYNPTSRGSKQEEQPQRMTQKLLRSGVRLGDLYDAQKDQFLSGTSLWSTQVLKKVKLDNRQIQQSSDLKFSTGKTTLDRLSLMDKALSSS